MQLTNAAIPACAWKTGQEKIELLPPSNLKIVTTGDVPMVLLNDGPTHGKKWEVMIRLEITETDA
jgi:hypothetical protein